MTDTWDGQGRCVPDHDDEGREVEPAKSVLNRWRILNHMRPPGMTPHRFRILSVIFMVVPPGQTLRKSRPILEKNSGVKTRTVKGGFGWAYQQGILLRDKGRQGCADRNIGVDYLACIRYTAQSLAEIEDEDRRTVEVDRLAQFGRALGGNQRWESGFRDSVARAVREAAPQKRQKRTGASAAPPSAPHAPPSAPHAPLPAKTGARDAPPLVHEMHPRSSSLSVSTSERNQEVDRKDGTEQDQGPLRTSLSKPWVTCKGENLRTGRVCSNTPKPGSDFCGYHRHQGVEIHG